MTQSAAFRVSSIAQNATGELRLQGTSRDASYRDEQALLKGSIRVTY